MPTDWREVEASAAPLKISEKTDAIVEPSLHDGHLVGISLPAKHTVELIVTDQKETTYRIILKGVSRFVANDFREGNIIFDVTVSRGVQAPMDCLEEIVGAGPDGKVNEKSLRAIHERVLMESLYVVSLNPSYGCSLIAITESISIFHGDGRPHSST